VAAQIGQGAPLAPGLLTRDEGAALVHELAAAGHRVAAGVEACGFGWKWQGELRATGAEAGDGDIALEQSFDGGLAEGDDDFGLNDGEFLLHKLDSGVHFRAGGLAVVRALGASVVGEADGSWLMMALVENPFGASPPL